MDVKLREYQVKALHDLYDSFRSGNDRVIWCLPTGAGKSTVASRFVKACVKNDKRVLFAVHSKELVQQFSKRLWGQFGIRSGVIMAGVKPAREYPVQVASVMSLVRRKHPDADVVIIDEAHRSKAKSYLKILANYPEAKVVGLTATPFRGDGRGLGNGLFQSIVHPVRLRQLIDLGYLVGTQVYAPKTAIDLTGIRTKRGDFDMEETFKRYNDQVAYQEVADNYLRHSAGKKAIVFNINIQHSKLQTQAFKSRGISAEHLDGETPKAERSRIVSRFANGEIMVLNNVGLFTEGFDVPDTEAVILNRPTKSLGLYVQMVGRGLRPADDKDVCIVLDHAGNTLRHGFVEDYDILPFSLSDKQKVRGKGKDDRVPPTKECPACQFIQPNARKTCKQCGYTWPVQKVELVTRSGEPLAVMDKDALLVERLLGLEWRQVKKLPIHLLQVYEILKGYSYGWALHKAIDSGQIEGLAYENGEPVKSQDTFRTARFQMSIKEKEYGTDQLIKQLRRQAKDAGGIDYDATVDAIHRADQTPEE